MHTICNMIKNGNLQDGSLLLADTDGLLELLTAGTGTCGVIGRTNVNDISAGKTGKVGEETILGRAGHVDNIVVLHGLLVLVSGLAQHDGSIDIDGVGGVLDCTDDVGAKHLLDTHDIALGAIRDKHFFWGNKVLVQDGGNLRSKLVVALLCSISRVSVLGSELRGTADEARKDMLGDRLGGVADAEGDDAIGHLGVLFKISRAAAANLGEEVAASKLGEVGVAFHAGHGEGCGASARLLLLRGHESGGRAEEKGCDGELHCIEILNG